MKEQLHEDDFRNPYAWRSSIRAAANRTTVARTRTTGSVPGPTAAARSSTAAAEKGDQRSCGVQRLPRCRAAAGRQCQISGLEAFLTQYPNSVMKQDALQFLIGSYQQAGNQQKMIDTAQKL